MNYTALSQQPTKSQLTQFERKYPKSQATRKTTKVAQIILIVVGGFFLIGGVQSLIAALTQDIHYLSGSIIILAFAALIGLSVLFLHLGAKKQRRISAKIAFFSEQNGLSFTRTVDNPTYTGMLFNVGKDRQLNNIITSRLSRPKFEIGNLKYTIRAGESQTTYTKGYIRIELERNLPQIVLDATSNNLKMFGKNMTNLPVDFQKSQRMSLEGDFDKYFSLYAPKEYERDALYIFTPDLMALMIDNVSAFDAEIIDNQLFIYNTRLPFNLTDSATLERLFKIIEIVGGKTHSQTDFYADEKVGDRAANTVAEGGKRLKTRVSVITVIIFALIAAVIGIQIIVGILSA